MKSAKSSADIEELNVQNTPVNPSTDYAAARKEWDDRVAGQADKIRFLAATTILSLMIGVMGLGYGIYTGVRTQFLPYLIGADNLGRTEVFADPQLLGDWPPQVIKRELDQFFDRMRTITPDMSVIIQNHNAIENFLPAGTAALNKVHAYFNEPGNQPIKRAEKETVAVEVVSVNLITGSSWRVEWLEKSYSRNSGRLRKTKRYVATTQIEFRRPKSRELIKINPLGLFITDIDIQEVRN